MAELPKQVVATTTDPISEVMDIQMGPSHPATHGTIKFRLRLNGEVIDECDTEVGFLHRGFEKMCEQGTWTQCIPYTDRLNYASPLINNFVFTEAVERMLEISVPERCSYLRSILSRRRSGTWKALMKTASPELYPIIMSLRWSRNIPMPFS